MSVLSELPAEKASHWIPHEISKPCPRESRKENAKCLTEWPLEGNQESLAAEGPLSLF